MSPAQRALAHCSALARSSTLSARDPRIRAGKVTSAASSERPRYTVRPIAIEASLDVDYAHLGNGFVIIRPRAGYLRLHSPASGPKPLSVPNWNVRSFALFGTS